MVIKFSLCESPDVFWLGAQDARGEIPATGSEALDLIRVGWKTSLKTTRGRGLAFSPAAG